MAVPDTASKYIQKNEADTGAKSYISNQIWKGFLIMKKILCLLLALIMCILFVACGDQSTNNEKNAHSENASQNNEADVDKVKKIDKNIDSVAAELGLRDGSETLYSFIGAIAGKEYNDGNVELYQFEENSDAYREIISDDGVLKISAHKDGIVLIFPDGIEEDANLIKAFEELKFNK